MFESEPMNPQLKAFLRRGLTLLISLVILAFIHAIAARLPGAGLYVLPGYGIIAADLISAVIAVVAIMLVWRFARETGPWVAKAVPWLPEADSLMKSAVQLIIVVIAYTAFISLIIPFLARIGLVWVYYAVFLGLGAYPLYNVARILLVNADRIAALITGDKEGAGGADPAKRGTGGNDTLPGHPGEAMNRAPESGRSNNCPQCGSVLLPEGRFCPGCGREKKASS